MTVPGIAITGMACLFPQAPGPEAFWDNVLSGVSAIGEPPADWGGDLVVDPSAESDDRLPTARGGYLGDLAEFDPLALGVMPSGLDGAEPEHALALRVGWEALADAGCDADTVDGERTEVVLGRGTYVNRGFVAFLQHTFAVEQTLRVLRTLHPEHTPQELAEIKRELKAGLPPFTPETAPGLVSSVMCGRIANRLDLMGPAFVVDAACASSLIAIDVGMSDLLAGKCDRVVAGGVQVSSSFPIQLIFARLGALSRSGQLRPFSADADGTLLGEGIGMVVLRRLRDAERDGDRIYAVIRAVGTASDGRGAGVLAPRVEGEVLAMRRAYERADVAPGTVGLVEAHGTATPVGDAAELDALTRVFGENGSTPAHCALGSVKSMIGHTIPAAGAAGIIKAALALHHRVLPPTLHCESPHPALRRSAFFLNDEPRPWVHGARSPRRAAVSAFGFGGIDAHAILEEHGGSR
ncbi:beta-ketoacyl [acyl carrier protein] synthase domain-containing protein [Capillimicrobium parvum]|uniref:beta-ketoacyl [acyl carrier protein] synthase domain-containing protein n=1 Tax=Capillimicrobium parvum TaxID=2884022 RepID=UPI00216B1612|nr:polyketide synthase [Capillimicrobium parvum]